MTGYPLGRTNSYVTVNKNPNRVSVFSKFLTNPNLVDAFFFASVYPFLCTNLLVIQAKSADLLYWSLLPKKILSRFPHCESLALSSMWIFVVFRMRTTPSKIPVIVPTTSVHHITCPLRWLMGGPRTDSTTKTLGFLTGKFLSRK